MVSTERAEYLLRHWQAILRLQAWEIDRVWVDAAELEGESDAETAVAGTVHCDCERLQAVLTVALDRDDTDVERTILHELLHVLLADWKPGTAAACSYVPAALYAHLTEQRAQAEERVTELLERAFWQVVTCGN